MYNEGCDLIIKNGQWFTNKGDKKKKKIGNVTF